MMPFTRDSLTRETYTTCYIYYVFLLDVHYYLSMLFFLLCTTARRLVCSSFYRLCKRAFTRAVSPVDT